MTTKDQNGPRKACPFKVRCVFPIQNLVSTDIIYNIYYTLTFFEISHFLFSTLKFVLYILFEAGLH